MEAERVAAAADGRVALRAELETLREERERQPLASTKDLRSWPGWRFRCARSPEEIDETAHLGGTVGIRELFPVSC